MILGGINITDETSYTTSVKVPEINGEGRYDAEIKVIDADNAVTTVTRKIVVSNGSTAELPNSGQGSSKEESIAVQVIDADGITSLNEKLSKEIDEISKKVYRNLNCSGVVRIDYLIDTKKKEVYVNEINTIPGSLAYYLWEGKGTSYEELLENLITTTIKDYKKKMKKIASFETNILSNYNSQGLKGIKK